MVSEPGTHDNVRPNYNAVVAIESSMMYIVMLNIVAVHRAKQKLIERRQRWEI